MDQDDSAAADGPREDDELDRRVADRPGVAPARWVTRIVVALVVLVVAYLAFRIAAAYFPRWWAHRVGDQVDDDLTSGTLWGLFYGFLFSFVPVLLLFQVRRRFFSWTWRAVVLLVAVALAAPNWLTLSVVAGNSKAAHAGERIFDVEAPGFRAATLVGVVLGIGLAVLLTGTSIVMKRRRQQVRELRGERDELRRSREHDDDSR